MLSRSPALNPKRLNGKIGIMEFGAIIADLTFFKFFFFDGTKIQDSRKDKISKFYLIMVFVNYQLIADSTLVTL